MSIDKSKLYKLVPPFTDIHFSTPSGDRLRYCVGYISTMGQLNGAGEYYGWFKLADDEDENNPRSMFYFANAHLEEVFPEKNIPDEWQIPDSYDTPDREEPKKSLRERYNALPSWIQTVLTILILAGISAVFSFILFALLYPISLWTCDIRAAGYLHYTDFFQGCQVWYNDRWIPQTVLQYIVK